MSVTITNQLPACKSCGQPASTAGAAKQGKIPNRPKYCSKACAKKFKAKKRKTL